MATSPDEARGVVVVAREQAVSTRVARAAINASDRVAWIVTRFMVAYAALCCVLLRQLARRPTCSAAARRSRGCAWPAVAFRDGEGRALGVDLFVVTSLSNDPMSAESSGLAFARYNSSALESFEASIAVDMPAAVRQYGAPLSAHVFARAASESRNDTARGVARTSSHLGSVELTRLAETRRRDVYRNLLEARSERAPAVEEGKLWPHWRFGAQPLVVRVLDLGGDGAVPVSATLDGFPHLGVEALDAAWRDGLVSYTPVALLDDQAVLARYALPVSRNLSMPSPTLRLCYRVASPLVFALRNTVSRQLIDIAEAIMSDTDVDELRFHLSDQRVFRYFLSQAIGLVHLALDYLTFREDIGFYVGRETFRGLSASSLLWNLARSLIVLLYLADNQASALVLVSLARSVATELFKVIRVLQPTLHWTAAGFPTLKYRQPADRAERYTETLDKICTSHLARSLAPLLLGFSVYALIHHLHRSWYSWAISSLADLTYFFGFLTMIPQLYINYKLKSVAHLPVKVFLYKMFNTFIDDAFAWLVKMPMKHRVMTLRDDVVFIVFLYQYFIYRKDLKRPNEFGLAYEHESDVAAPSTSPSRAPARDDATATGDTAEPGPPDSPRTDPVPDDVPHDTGDASSD